MITIAFIKTFETPRIYIFSPPFCSDFTTSYMFYDKASCFKRSERTLFQTFIKCKGEWKPITPFAWILESLPGNPLLWLTHFWEIRANLKLFNRVYIFPRKQSFQLLTKNKNVSADHQRQICSFKLPVWQTGRYYCRIPDDPTLSLTNNHDGENNKVDPQMSLNQSTPMHNP